MSAAHTVHDACPCGTGSAYDACCGPLHAGAAAPTAERLMRSRYSAYVRGDAAYLMRSWHAGTRPAGVAPEPGLRWTGLQVLATTAGGMLAVRGTVTFAAAYVRHGAPGVLHERSVFVREGGQWLYVSPDPTSPDPTSRDLTG